MPVIGTLKLFRIELHGSFMGQSTLNRFWYTAPGDRPAAVVSLDFAAKLEAEWSAVVSIDWSGDKIVVDEVTALDNFHEEPIAWAGTLVGEALPPQSALDISLTRSTKETRSGRKRICGVSESSQSAGVLIAGVQANLQTLADEMASTFSSGVETFSPVIIRVTRDISPPDPDPPANWIFNNIASAIAISNVTTQNSRKYRTSP